jgi:hypothetical protein
MGTGSGHVARTGVKKRKKYFTWKTVNGEEDLRDLRVEGKIILK